MFVLLYNSLIIERTDFNSHEIFYNNESECDQQSYVTKIAILSFLQFWFTRWKVKKYLS